jgi:hypothetical protein
MAPVLFRTLLAFVALYAFLRGSDDARKIAVICVLGTVLTHLAWSPLPERFAGLEAGVLLVDLLVFAGFLWVALRSDRFWPLWIAGLQLTTILGHVLKIINVDLFSRAYGAALMFWSYPIVVILAVGTWRGVRRARYARRAAPI